MWCFNALKKLSLEIKVERRANNLVTRYRGSLTPNEIDPTEGIYGPPLTLKGYVKILKQANS